MKDIFSKYDEIWRTHWGDAQKYGPSHRIHRKIMLDVLGKISFSSLIEVGCGNGMNLYTLSRFHPDLRLAGCDISGEALLQFKKTIRDIPVCECDISTSFLPDKYDVVMSFDVLEHIEDDKRAISNMAQMAGRYLFVATMQGRMRNFERSIGHVRNYEYGELAKKITNAGMNVIYKVEWGWPLFSPIYRNYLDRFGGQEKTFGKYGIIKRILCRIIYVLFLFNSSKKGDMIFILAEKMPKTNERK